MGIINQTTLLRPMKLNFIVYSGISRHLRQIKHSSQSNDTRTFFRSVLGYSYTHEGACIQ